MAKGWNAKGQKSAQTKIVELEIRKRNGLLRAIASIVGFILIAALYTMGMYSWEAIEGSMIIRGAIYMAAMVLACTCGYGARAWYRADKEIKAIEQGLNKTKKQR